ncbi:MAG TPA: DUF5691 domain-containing protein, partial [Solirubrobacteraceae bacterium]|nr:DUF5691 domain-containing protein [Solirubrobacteraceae bacterium]
AWPELAGAAAAADDDELRAHVEERWEHESPEGRVELLDALAPTLAPADEPLLERALADRRKPVRLRAAELLSALPDSAYAQRLVTLAEPVLTLHGGIRGRRIDVEPPTELDPKLGLDLKRPRGRGERAHLLIQLLSAAPLRAWTERFGLTPDELVRARLPKEWRDDVLTGWIEATRQQHETEWARALVEHVPHLAASLASMLPPDEAERALAKRVRGGDLRDLPLHTGGWGPQLSRELVTRMDRVTEQELVRPVAAALHPSTLDDAATALQRIAERGSWTGRGAKRGLELITFRRAMLAALNEEPEG